MSFRTMLCLLALAGASHSAIAAPSGFPERKVFQFGQFTIEASAGDEAYVEALALRLVDFNLPPPPAPPILKLSLDDLEKRRDHFLGTVAGYLALPKATDSMGAVYDSFVKIWKNMDAVVPTEMPRRYSLWRRAELLARIEAGERIAGFSKDASGQLNFSFNFGLDSGAGDLEEKNALSHRSEYWRQFVCPINIGSQPGRAPAEDVSAGLEFIVKNVFDGFRDAVLNSQRQAVFNVLHETTENGIISQYLRSSDRRWFCDGVANYVAWKVIEADTGAGEARVYYDLPAELAKYGAEAARVDLAAWPAVENLKKMDYAENLNTASYAFATRVIADACAKHGGDLLPKLFQEIGRTSIEKASMKTVYKAYRKLTGEDLRASLPKPVAGQ